MARFMDIDPGWYFLVQNSDGFYIGEKLDARSLPTEMQGGKGSEHSMAIPPNADRDQFSREATYYHQFNTRVVAVQSGIEYGYDYCSGDRTVDAFAPRSLDRVISEFNCANPGKLFKR